MNSEILSDVKGLYDRINDFLSLPELQISFMRAFPESKFELKNLLCPLSW